MMLLMMMMIMRMVVKMTIKMRRLKIIIRNKLEYGEKKFLIGTKQNKKV